MTNSTKILLALSLLAGLSACGDDSKSNPSVDAGGPVVVPVDGGNKADTGVVAVTPTNDAGPTNPTDGGGTLPTDCFTGTPVAQADFLNRCTSAQTTTKTLAVPAALLTADGGVLPL
ncbi:MAG: hypothetical protein JWN04_6737 [Myxococcaceae bacterium]|nr:hypothetical protein [Myxococcaceae bacterium]